MTSEGLGEMFEGDSADMCAGKFPLTSMGGRAEGLACADPGARTPIGVSGILNKNRYKSYESWPIWAVFSDHNLRASQQKVSTTDKTRTC